MTNLQGDILPSERCRLFSNISSPILNPVTSSSSASRESLTSSPPSCVTIIPATFFCFVSLLLFEDLCPSVLRSGLAGLVQRCVIIQKDDNGFGLTVSGDNPVFVQLVKEGEVQRREGGREGGHSIVEEHLGVPIEKLLTPMRNAQVRDGNNESFIDYCFLLIKSIAAKLANSTWVVLLYSSVAGVHLQIL